MYWVADVTRQGGKVVGRAAWSQTRFSWPHSPGLCFLLFPQLPRSDSLLTSEELLGFSSSIFGQARVFALVVVRNSHPLGRPAGHFLAESDRVVTPYFDLHCLGFLSSCVQVKCPLRWSDGYRKWSANVLRCCQKKNCPVGQVGFVPAGQST